MSNKINRREFLEIGGKAALGLGILLPSLGWSQEISMSARALYVAPQARKKADGTDPRNAAKWTDAFFWEEVESLLEDGDVVVNFVGGTYQVSDRRSPDMPGLSLNRVGHDSHQLTLQGMSSNTVRITRHLQDGTKTGPGLLKLSRCRNLTLRHLTFTAPRDHRIDYATRFDRCQNVTADHCAWVDLPEVHYAATGAQREESDQVVYSNCRFVRIGRRTGAHMAYNAYGPKRTSYINCVFEDCSGDYIRFRSGSDYNVIAGCTFRSTGTYTSKHMPFISIPVFNTEGRDETFGSHFLIFNNAFIYQDDEKPETRIAIVFHHSGYDPPNRRHLLDAEEAKIFRSGSVERKRALLRENLGLNSDTIHVYGNSYHNVAHPGIYRSQAGYGSESRGGDGIYDISDTFNAEPVVQILEQALNYFRVPALELPG